MKEYDLFVNYYDKIVRGVNSPLEEEFDFIMELIESYHNNTKTLLECACGTGVILKELDVYFDVFGLDINQKMLDKAKENISSKKLIKADMTNFDLDKKFDVVLCNYNSICHLLTFEDWIKFFDCSYNHLNKNGVLIFDINTLYEFNNLVRDFSIFYNFDDDSVCLEMFKEKGFFYWLIKIFKKAEDGRFDLIEERVRENSFGINKIKKELDKKYLIKNIVDFHKGELDCESERVYFIAQKK